MPAALAETTLRLALATAGGVPPAIAALAEAAVAGARVKLWGVLLAVVLLTAGAGVWTHLTWGGPAAALPEDEPLVVQPPAAPHDPPAKDKTEPAPPRPEKTVAEKPPEDRPPAPLPWPRKDREGNPLPAGVAERLGTTRLVQPDPVRLMEFSPDGKMLATAGGSWVYLWDTATGKELKRLECEAFSLAFSPKSSMLAICGVRKESKGVGLYIWNTEVDDVWPVGTRRSFRKSLLLSFSEDASHVWTLDNRAAQSYALSLRGKAQEPDVQIAPDGTIPLALVSGKDGPGPFVAIAARDRIRFLDGNTGKPTWQSNPERVEFTTLAVRDGIVAAGTARGEIHLWDDRGRPIGKPLRQLSTPVRALALSGSGDDLRLTTLATRGDGIELRLWNPRAGKELTKLTLAGSAWFKPGPRRVILSSDGKRAAAVDGGTQRPRLWDCTTGRELLASPGHHRAVQQVAFGPDGKTATSLGRDGDLHRWTLGTDQGPRQLREPQARSTVLGLSPNGQTVAAGSAVRFVELWDCATEIKIGTIDAPEAPRCVAAAPDGKSLAFGTSRDFTLWRVGEIASRGLDTGKEAVNALEFSADGKRLVVLTTSSIRLWEVSTIKRLQSFSAPYAPWPGVIALDPGGRLLAAASLQGNSVTLYDLATGQVVRRRGRDLLRIHSLCFALGGRLLVAGDDEGVTLWETASGGEVLHLTGHRGPVNAVAASPDGRRLVSGSDDTTVLVWDLPAAWKETAPPISKGKPAPTFPERYAALRGEAAPAYRALFSLAAERDAVIPLLKRELISSEKPAVLDRQRRLVAELADPNPKVRSVALDGLRIVGAPAEPWLRQALAAAKDEKLRARLRGLLAELEADGVLDPGTDAKAASRSVALLELIGTTQAWALLDQLAHAGRTGAVQQEAQRVREQRLPEKGLRP